MSTLHDLWSVLLEFMHDHLPLSCDGWSYGLAHILHISLYPAWELTRFQCWLTSRIDGITQDWLLATRTVCQLRQQSPSNLIVNRRRTTSNPSVFTSDCTGCQTGWWLLRTCTRHSRPRSCGQWFVYYQYTVSPAPFRGPRMAKYSISRFHVWILPYTVGLCGMHALFSLSGVYTPLLVSRRWRARLDCL